MEVSIVDDSNSRGSGGEDGRDYDEDESGGLVITQNMLTSGVMLQVALQART
jgi:hypothetical protein